MSKKSPIRRIFRIFLGVILGIVLLLLTTVTVILVTPGARTAVLNKCVKEVNERTDWDVDLGRLYLSPFHHSPMTLYHAYKGTEDLPLHIEIAAWTRSSVSKPCAFRVIYIPTVLSWWTNCF